MTAAAPVVRRRIRVVGIVQGVGFRPFVYRLAADHDLSGWVLNDERGVLAEVEGPAVLVDEFCRGLQDRAPPLAVVDEVRCEPVAPTGQGGFRILGSERAGTADAPVAPDSATCAECLAELHDPSDRRHRYPFINCTNCGPRFTIVRGVPYDRPLTTMAPFRMCPQCRREYEDPADRRFHAQPNACPRCGPSVVLSDPEGQVLCAATPDAAGAPLAALAARLAQGAIAAIKGLGGYHLACDAADDDVVAALRGRKHREDKPFALMVGSLEQAERLVELGAAEAQLLTGPQRPIVLARRRPGTRVARSVAPGAPELGLMLPYTPLHHLLLDDFARAGGSALVMTSGNVSDEPIAYRDSDALQRLAPIADLFLVHDREIETRTDDSVLRAALVGGARRPLMLRRSRGYVPSPLQLPVPARVPLLACGAQQKSAFCLARGRRAWVGHHIGDLEHFATHHAYREGVAHFERLFAVEPELVAHDLHPGYMSTAYALEREAVKLLAVQHHHAHLAACLAEHSVADRTAVGVIYDGTGYGTDATVWGGELLVGDLVGFERAGWLWPVRMPGGGAAIRQPWRMAVAWLAEALADAPPARPPRLLRGSVEAPRWSAMAQVAASSAVSPVTSSVGRLFDAVGALCGLAAQVSYEGQAAVELEALAARVTGPVPAYEIELRDGPILDPRPALRALHCDLEHGRAEPSAAAAAFHDALARATAAAVVQIAGDRSLDTAVLSGGVFQNRRLLEDLAARLVAAGLRVLVPERLPPNDGGIAFGQAAVAAAALQP